jgi:transcriptional regulator with XRE-family HTH domain
VRIVGNNGRAARRLGRWIATERVRKGFATAGELAEASGLSDRTVEILEAGSHTGQPRDTTLAKIEQALGWEPGSADRILAGGQPTDVADPLLARVLAAWPHLTGEQQVRLAEAAERARRAR